MPNAGGRCGNRTHWPYSYDLQFSKLLHYHPAHLPNLGAPWWNRTTILSFEDSNSIRWTNDAKLGTSWQIRTADLLRVKETFYHWNNEAHNMAESRGVEPHPISQNPVFKASRRTNPAALLSITLVANSGNDPLTYRLSSDCSTSELIGNNLGAA